MVKDIANIFKLPKDELALYENDPFWDAFDSTKEFADELTQDIDTKETPQILMLEGKFGIGKTFFSTRFAQGLSKKYHTVYFSAWENDYLQDPFLAFSKVLIQYFKQKHPIKSTIKDSSDTITEVLKAGARASSFSCAIGVGAKAEASFDCEKFIDSLDEYFQGEQDPIDAFREKLKNFIKNTGHKKLVIIVDDLDRCRPDYAMKVLEITKHFFDVEGIFVIIPTNKKALNTALTSLYGIEPEYNEVESYYKKFFNDEREIPKPNYLFTVKSIMTKEALANALKVGHLVFRAQNKTEGEFFNEYETLLEKTSHYAEKAHFSLRQTRDICYEIIRLCNNFYEEVRCDYLAYLICNKEKNKEIGGDGKRLHIQFNPDHPYNEGRSANKQAREDLFNFYTYRKALNDNLPNFNEINFSRLKYVTNKYEQINNFITTSLNLLPVTGYKEAEIFIEKTKAKFNEFKPEIATWQNEANKERFETFFNAVLPALEKDVQKIQQLKQKYDGDDNLKTRKDTYNEIITHPNKLWKYKKEPASNI